VPHRLVEAPPALADLEPGPIPLFSVIVAAHNAARVIGEALESAYAQTAPPLEVIVCDDGSTDDLDRALRPHSDRILLIQQPQRGEAAAKNAAAAAASGDFVAVLDADDVYLPARLEALGELAAARPDLDILTTDAFLEAGGQVIRRCYDETWRFEVDDQRTAILQRNFVFGLAAVRRETLLSAGGFDESLRWACDWDRWLRLILAGSRVGLVKEPLARYRLGSSSLTAQRTQLYRGRVAVLEKALRSELLSAEERAVASRALARERGRAATSTADDAVRHRAPNARGLALEAARAPQLPLRARLRALAQAAAPAAARRLSSGRRTAAAGVELPREGATSAPTQAEGNGP
jgi:glycosyltransferase involved in cell wall biosynthesis